MILTEAEIKGLEALTGGRFDPVRKKQQPDQSYGVEVGLIGGNNMVIEIEDITEKVSRVEVVGGESEEVVFDKLFFYPNEKNPSEAYFRGWDQLLKLSSTKAEWVSREEDPEEGILVK